MRKASIIIVSGYIAVISIMLAGSVYHGAFQQLFADPVSWQLHTAVSVLLAVMGTVIVACLFLRPSIVPMLHVLWWLPQLVRVEFWRFTPDKSRAVSHSLYHWPPGVTFALQLGWEKTPNDCLFVKLNLVALGGIILALALWRRQRVQTVATTDNPIALGTSPAE